MRINSPYLRAVTVVSGFIIGAGIFGVAYTWSHSGYFIGLLELIGLSAVITLAHLMFGEIILRTKTNHRLPGLAALYLGRRGKRLAAISNILGGLGALLAYVIIGGTFLWQLTGTIFPFGQFSYQLIFFLFMGTLVISGLRMVAKVEYVLTLLMIGTILFIVAWGAPHVRLENLLLPGRWYYALLPFGVLVFSLGGWAAIPEAKEVLGQERKKLKSVILAGSLIAAFITALFASAILGISGKGTTEEAIDGLLPVLGYGVVTAGTVFGVLAIATSFLILGIYLQETLQFDFKLPKDISAALTLGVPFALFLLGARSFIKVISITGGVFGAIDVILIMLIYRVAVRRGERKPEYSLSVPGFFIWLVIGAFVIGGLYEIIAVLL